MSAAAFAVTLFGGLAALAVVLNHIYARLALVELALNEGLPPGHDVSRAPAQVVSVGLADVLDPGLHIFLSRNCHACQRLVRDLDELPFEVGAAVHLRYIDRPRPIASAVASKMAAELHENEASFASMVGADPLPYSIAIGQHGLIASQVSPAIADVVSVARDAGLQAKVNSA